MATEAGKEGKAVANLRLNATALWPSPSPRQMRSWKINADLKILYSTGAVQRLLDRAPEELAGQPLLDLIVPQSVPLVRAALDIAQQQGRFGPVSLRIATDKPTRVAAFWHLSAGRWRQNIRGAERPPHGGVGTSRHPRKTWTGKTGCLQKTRLTHLLSVP